MIDVHSLRKSLKDRQKVEYLRYLVARKFVFFFACVFINFLIFSFFNHNVWMAKAVSILLVVITATLFLHQTCNYIIALNHQASLLISQNALRNLVTAFQYFDRDQYVLKNLSHNHRLDVMLTYEAVPKRMYFDYICCCREMILRLSLYKRTNEKIPGTFSSDIDDMFRRSKI